MQCRQNQKHGAATKWCHVYPQALLHAALCQNITLRTVCKPVRMQTLLILLARSPSAGLALHVTSFAVRGKFRRQGDGDAPIWYAGVVWTTFRASVLPASD